MFRRTLTIAASTLVILVLSRSWAGAAVGLDIHGKTLSAAQLRPLIAAAPPIHYPRLSRAVRSRGLGLFEMRIDPATGKVSEVVIIKSTGARILDIECLRALGHWLFKAGTVRVVRQAVDFRLSWRANMPDEGY